MPAEGARRRIAASPEICVPVARSPAEPLTVVKSKSRAMVNFGVKLSDLAF
jgi:hypothetical protein